jgi:hypothetical protein
MSLDKVFWELGNFAIFLWEELLSLGILLFGHGFHELSLALLGLSKLLFKSLDLKFFLFNTLIELLELLFGSLLILCQLWLLFLKFTLKSFILL